MSKFGKEHFKFFLFLVIIIALTPFLMDLISRSWSTDLVRQISNSIRTVDPSGISVIINLIIGFYIGSIILLFIDRYKRIQAGLLAIGIFIIISSMSDDFNVTWNLLYIAVGIVIAIFLGIIPILRKTSSRKRKNEFEQAAKNISIVSVSYIVIAFLIVYASYQSSSFIQDAIVVLVFAYFFREIMSYRTEGKIFVLGPAESGKTLFLIGCYKRILDITDIPARASDDLLLWTDELHKGTWPSRTRAISRFQFTFETGKIFPKETTLKTIDYPGVYLEDIYNYLSTKKDIREMGEAEKKYAEATQEVTKADRLIFIIDGNKYPNFGEMGILHYVRIITKLHENGKDIKPYIIITKSDLFREEYPDYEADYDGFKSFIEEKFLHNMYIQQLLNEASGATFYPVFYYTQIVNDERIPLRDRHGNLYTYGFDKFMDKLIEE